MPHTPPTFATQVDFPLLFKFLFPPSLEYPESTGRLDLFALYGPLDTEGQLRAGPQGFHVVQHYEIKGMVKELYQEELFKLVARPRETVRVVVDELTKKALKHFYLPEGIRRLFNSTPRDNDGYMQFEDLQRVILADLRQRMLTLIDGGEITTPPPPPIPYQSEPARILATMQKKKKMLPSEEFMVVTQLLHQNVSLITDIDSKDKNDAVSLRLNNRLLRDKGKTDDRWDRYCALRGQKKGTWVKTAKDFTKENGGPNIRMAAGLEI